MNYESCWTVASKRFSFSVCVAACSLAKFCTNVSSLINYKIRIKKWLWIYCRIRHIGAILVSIVYFGIIQHISLSSQFKFLLASFVSKMKRKERRYWLEIIGKEKIPALASVPLAKLCLFKLMFILRNGDYICKQHTQTQ